MTTNLSLTTVDNAVTNLTVTRTREGDLCGAWGPDDNAHVRCHLPEGHDGMHRSDYTDGSRRRWDAVNFDPFAHTGGGYATD